jgi:hypothetical protein
MREFQEVAIAFCNADLPDPSYSRAAGELFCIT